MIIQFLKERSFNPRLKEFCHFHEVGCSPEDLGLNAVCAQELSFPDEFLASVERPSSTSGIKLLIRREQKSPESSFFLASYRKKDEDRNKYNTVCVYI